jgi:excisionase family DNA binding protein
MCMTAAAAAADPNKDVPIGVAAKLLQCHVDTVRRYEAAGKLPSRRTLGNQRRFKVADLLALLQQTGVAA